MSDTTPRTPDTIRKHGNRLAGEGSAYLRQHAHNPLDWYPWTDEAIERARREDKPIFLSVGYSSCHWCHVMEHETFEDDDVATFLNERFVSIKVDREERPDLDSIYMEAVQRLTGGGGWPMSVFLTPDLQPFFGGTYFPKDTFLHIAKRIHEAWTQQRMDVAADAQTLSETIGSSLLAAPRDGESAPGLAQVRAAVERLQGTFDAQWGGEGHGMKFPTPPVWSLCLRLYRKTGDGHAEGYLRCTLDAMADGGIHDHVGGGFHRYTVERTWLVPHFEKMLYDNAQLAALYLEASVALNEPRYRDVALATLDFMIRDLSGEPTVPDVAGTRGFFGSYDADSAGEEGLFYLWTPSELRDALGNDADADALAALLAVREEGNFEGRTILTRRVAEDDVADNINGETDEIFALWERARETLYAYRARREWPALDRKVVTAWNGMAIGAFAKGYQLTRESKYRVAAEQTAQYLRQVNRRPEDGRLYRASTDGAPAADGVLDDYAALAKGLLELYQATGDVAHLTWARELLDLAERYFAGPEPAAPYYFTPQDIEAPLGRQVEVIDSVEPSGNSMLLQAQQMLAALSGEPRLYRAVGERLARHADLFGRAGTGMATWGEVALLHEGPLHELVVAGEPGAADTDALLAPWRELLTPHVVCAHVPAAGADASDAIAVALPAVRDKAAVDGRAAAYVCRHGACERPTLHPHELPEALRQGWFA